MEAIPWFAYRIIQVWLWLYPFVLWFAIKGGTLDKRGPDNENRSFAMYLALVEYEKTEAINMMLQQMGKEPYNHVPVATKFKSAGWRILKAQCSNNLRIALSAFSWLGLVKGEEDGKL
jgi:hypothetical protein